MSTDLDKDESSLDYPDENQPDISYDASHINNHKDKTILAEDLLEKHQKNPRKDKQVGAHRKDSQAKISPRAGWAMIYITAAALSLFLRLFKIDFTDSGSSPVFDEKHYAPQAYQMLFIPGHQEAFPGYGLVVHPPLGKVLISIGESIFGYTPLGWRIMPVIAGILIMLMLMRIAHIVTGNMAVVAAVALLANVEGTQLFMSRIAMLDIFMALFITAMALCIIKDFYSDTSNTPWHLRGWLLLSGIFAGCAMAVKLSGVFYPAFMGIALVLIVAISSKNVLETFKALGMGLVFYLVVPLTVFLLSWVPWFANENSVYRHIAQANRIEHHLPEWLARILPDSINSFASYQMGVAQFHTSLESGVGIDNFHPWESKPEQWFIGARPMLFSHTNATENEVLFGSGSGEYRLVLFANMAVWALIIPVIIWGLVQLLKNRKPEWLVVLSGLAVGIVPWFIAYDRQQYFFYTVSWSMFVIVGIALALYELAGILVDKTDTDTNSALFTVYVPYLIVAVVVFILYLPWLYNIPMTSDYHEKITLFDSWKQFAGYK